MMSLHTASTSELVLFSKDRPLAVFQGDGPRKIRILKIYPENRHLLPLAARGDDTESVLAKWLLWRISGNGFSLLRSMGQPDIRDMFTALKVTRGLSAIDAFWVGDGREVWDLVNFRTQGMSEDIAEAAFGRGDKKKASNALLDGELSPEFTLDGNQWKRWVWIDGKLFLKKVDLDCPTDIQNQCVAEVLARAVEESAGLESVPYSLALEHFPNREEIVCLCPCLTDEHTGLAPAEEFLTANGISAKDTSTPSDHMRIADIWGREIYEDMMVFDAIIGNIDRHLANFGVLFDIETGKVLRPAPLYDNGLSFITRSEIKPQMPLEEQFSKYDHSCWFPMREQMELFASRRQIPMVEKMRDTQLRDAVSDNYITQELLDYAQQRLQWGCNMFFDVISGK